MEVCILLTVLIFLLCCTGNLSVSLMFESTSSVFLKRFTWAGEMAQLVKYLLYKHEDQCPVPIIHIKKLDAVCQSGGRTPRVCWLGSQAP